MQDLFELTPELLLEQSREMMSLCAAYEALFAGVSADLSGINGSWSDLLANNFSGKIGSAQKTFSGTLQMLRNSAESAATVAQTAGELDADWAARISSRLMAALTPAGSAAVTAEAPTAAPVDMETYCHKASHAEYARLCQLWQEADRACDSSSNAALAGTFAALLQNNLPENDPLAQISQDQIRVLRSESGLSAAIIGSGDQALVIFAGTDFSKANDVISDAMLVAGWEGPQEKEAKALIDALSKEYKDIKVTGHSLGGYLATAATLDNEAVSQCVAFDPPGRKNRDEQLLFNNKQYSKVTTYKAVGSPVSSYVAGNRGIGKVKPVFVEPNPMNHGIKQICEALGGDEEIGKNWN